MGECGECSSTRAEQSKRRNMAPDVRKYVESTHQIVNCYGQFTVGGNNVYILRKDYNTGILITQTDKIR